MMASGSGSISGQVIFVWRESTPPITCAGSFVTLLPATPYAKQWFPFHLGESGDQNRYSDLTKLTPAASGFLNVARTAQCDASGSFRFENVKAGNYFLHSAKSWHLGREPVGRTFYSMIKVDANRTTEVIFASMYRMPNSKAPFPSVDFSKPIW